MHIKRHECPFFQKKLLIDGKQTGAVSGRSFETIDPASEEVIATVAEAGVEDTDLAVASARRALEGPWGQMRASERGKILYRFADLLEQNGDEVAAIESRDAGKPISAVLRQDLPSAVDTLR